MGHHPSLRLDRVHGDRKFGQSSPSTKVPHPAQKALNLRRLANEGQLRQHHELQRMRPL